MNGYLERMALSAMKPGGDIQPVVGSLFSPPNPAAGPETPSMETVKLVIPSDNPELEARTDPASSFDAPGTRVLPGSKSCQSVDPVGSRIPTPARAPLVPRPKEKRETKIAPLLAPDNSEPLQGRTLKPQQETIVHAIPDHNVADDRGAIGPANIIAAEQNPANHAVKNLRARPAIAMLAPPAAGSLIEPPVETPRVEPGSGKEAVAAPTSPNPVARAPKTRLALRKTIASQGIYIERGGDRPAAVVTRGAATAGSLAALASKPLAYGAPRKEGTRPPRSASQPQPDEIQIHIGRIEVIAVPPAQVPLGLAKTQRTTPSLDEYLRRRDGRPV